MQAHKFSYVTPEGLHQVPYGETVYLMPALRGFSTN